MICGRSHRLSVAARQDGAVLNINGASSDLNNQNIYDLSVSECLNCVLLEKQLRSALEEV